MFCVGVWIVIGDKNVDAKHTERPISRWCQTIAATDQSGMVCVSFGNKNCDDDVESVFFPLKKKNQKKRLKLKLLNLKMKSLKESLSK